MVCSFFFIFFLSCVFSREAPHAMGVIARSRNSVNIASCLLPRSLSPFFSLPVFFLALFTLLRPPQPINRHNHRLKQIKKWREWLQECVRVSARSLYTFLRGSFILSFSALSPFHWVFQISFLKLLPSLFPLSPLFLFFFFFFFLEWMQHQNEEFEGNYPSFPSRPSFQSKFLLFNHVVMMMILILLFV